MKNKIVGPLIWLLNKRGLIKTLVFGLICWIPDKTFAQSTLDKPSVSSSQQMDRPLEKLPYTPGLDVTSMDRSINPCVDFYQYACGGWIHNHPIPKDEAYVDVFSKLQKENLQYLWGLLEKAAIIKTNRPQVEQKLGDSFFACMNESAIEKADILPLQAEFTKLEQAQNWNELAQLIGKWHIVIPDEPMLFEFKSGIYLHDATQVIPFLSTGRFGLPDQDYYLDTDVKTIEIQNHYQQHIQKMLELTGIETKSAQQAARQIFSLEKQLAQVKLSRVQLRDRSQIDHLMTFAQLQELTPSFPWKEYFSTTWKKLELNSTSNITATTTITSILEKQSLNVTQPAFYRELEKQIKTQSITTWKYYLRWHLISVSAPYLSKRFAEEKFGFEQKYLQGVETMPPRWQQCVKWVDQNLGEALGKVFVEKTFSPQTKKRALVMIEQIESVMKQHLEQLPWMKNETKAQALEKLRLIRNKVGYPTKWLRYDGLSISRTAFFENVKRSHEFHFRRQLDKIGKPVDQDEWSYTVPTVTAGYSFAKNDITVPAGILQPPLFDPHMDDAPNYGNTGASIGHELIHAFDDKGRKSDGHGNLRNWWTKEDSIEFQKRAQCVEDQYSQYVVIDDIKGNGKLALGENIADLSGLTLAYEAWKLETKGKKLQPLQGLTPAQRFFVGNAQWACLNETPQSKRLSVKTDVHAESRYRVNGAMANLPPFHQAFQCQPGKPMVRKNICQIW